jgi:hypothetical protein
VSPRSDRRQKRQRSEWRQGSELRQRFRGLSAALFFLSISPPLAGPAPAAEAPQLVDRILATVDGDPILQSDLDRLLGLGAMSAREGESPEALRRRGLDRLIENRLRLHELDRFGYGQAPLEEIDRRYQRVRDRFASATEFSAELERLGLDDVSLRLLVARQISILAYVEERLGPRVFVGVEDIRRYYDEELVPELAAKGEKAPPIETVREQIRGVLRERRLNEEIDRWTVELRGRADIEDFLDQGAKELPPVVRRIEAPPR